MYNFSIEQITIENFRGIPGPLSLDLSAPLTVIYAANGSGKSSVCQAIEWLLTGHVFSVPVEAQRCFNAVGERRVWARCRLGSEEFELIRTPSDLMCFRNGTQEKIADIDLLASITPEETGKDGRVDVRQRLKTDWLRSSRWLYSSALSLLVDNDHAERRQQIFANILGYGHLIPIKSKLETYIAALPSARSLIAKRKEIEDEIQNLASEATLNPYWKTHFAQHIKQINHLTGAGFVQNENDESTYETTALHLSQKEQDVQLRLRHLNKILAGVDTLRLAAVTEKELREHLATVSAEHRKVTLKVSQLTQLSTYLEQQKKEADTRIAKRKEEIQKLLKWPDLRQKLVKLISVDADELTLDKVNVAFPDIHSREQSQSRFKAWLAFSAIKQQLELQLNRVDALKRQITQIPTREALNALESDTSSAQHALRQKQAQYESMSTAAEQLYILGLDVARKTQSNECPLCREPQHDHLTLIQRINAIQNSVSPAKEQAFSEVETAKGAAEAALTAYNAANKRLKEGEQAQRDYDALYIDMNALIEKSEIRVWEPECSISSLIDNQETSLERSQLACDLNELLILADEDITADGSLDSVVNHSLNRLRSRDGDDARLVAGLVTSHEESVIDLGINTKAFKRLEQECEKARSHLASFLTTLAPLQESWRFLTGEASFNEERSQQLRVQQAQDSDAIQKARSHLEKAQILLRSSQGAKRLNALKTKLTLVNERIQKRESRVATGERALGVWTKHVNEIADSSLNQFLTPASELFSKMHANEVYHSLNMGRTNDAFCWQAATREITGKPGLIDAQSHFSQGQRQDPALSLFLARARNLNGSFFLDEPVAHLDDLNRVAMMDIFRMLTASEPHMHLVLTTASNHLRRHLRQKFSSNDIRGKLRIITLEGNPNQGVSASYS